MTEATLDQEKKALLDVRRKQFASAAKLNEPITGSLALKLQTGKNLDESLLEVGDIDIALTDPSKLDEIYEMGLEEVPCKSDGWESRVIENTFQSGSTEVKVKLVHIMDIVHGMTEMWVKGNLNRIQPIHAKKLARQISFLKHALVWSSNSNPNLTVFLESRLKNLKEWILLMPFEDETDKQKVLGQLN